VGEKVDGRKEEMYRERVLNIRRAGHTTHSLF
jgi:hypothetical protein